MTLEDLALLSRRGRVRVVVLIVALVVGVVWAAAHFLQPPPPRREGRTGKASRRATQEFQKLGLTLRSGLRPPL